MWSGPAEHARGALVALGVVVLLADCAEKPPMVKSPDGSAWWYVIECTGSRADCMDEAAEVCPHGYSIMDADETGSRGTGVRVGRFGFGRTTTEQEIMVQCKHRSDS